MRRGYSDDSTGKQANSPISRSNNSWTGAMTKNLAHVSPNAKRRNLMIGGIAATLTTTVASAASKQTGPGATRQMSTAGHTGDVIRTRDGVSLYFKDWGAKDGPIVTLSHGWPLSSDSWENQAFFLASRGFRVIT